MTDIRKYRWLIVVMTVYYAVFYGTDRLIDAGGSGAYILAFVVTAVSAVLYMLLYNKKSVSLFDADKITFDIRISGVILLVSVFVQTVSVCTYSVEAISGVFMKKSPFPYILFFVMFPTLFGAYFGIKSVSRYSLVAGTLILFMIGLILLFVYEDYLSVNIHPVLGKGYIGIGSFFRCMMLFSNIIYLFVLSSECNNTQNSVRTEIVKVILISGAVFAGICLVCNLTVPYEALGCWHDPLLYIASTVNFSFVVRRSEALVFLIWIFVSFLTIASLLCFVCSLAAKLFNLSNRKAVIGAVSIVVASSAMLTYKNNMTESLISFSLFCTGVVSIVVPIVLRIICALRKERQ